MECSRFSHLLLIFLLLGLLACDQPLKKVEPPSAGKDGSDDPTAENGGGPQPNSVFGNITVEIDEKDKKKLGRRMIHLDSGSETKAAKVAAQARAAKLMEVIPGELIVPEDAKKRVRTRLEKDKFSVKKHRRHRDRKEVKSEIHFRKRRKKRGWSFYGNKIGKDKRLNPRHAIELSKRKSKDPEKQIELAQEAQKTIATGLEGVTKEKDERYFGPYSNYVRSWKSSREPQDELYEKQWHYKAIGVPGAWSSDLLPDKAWDGEDSEDSYDPIIVAVIDTGIRYGHPDLKDDRVFVDGWDFISDDEIAGEDDQDEEGMDNKPEDTDPMGYFHGTHVAGTIAAIANNDGGVVGVAPHPIVKIMPLRVLGVGGSGSDWDIGNAILYAAGLENSSGELPSKRADIINMSLGGPGESAFLKEVIEAAAAEGVIIVASAGNENTFIPSYPAAYYNHVIGVGAVSIADPKEEKFRIDGFDVGFGLERAPYSNYGVNQDIMAPGGNVDHSYFYDKIYRSGLSFNDGVLSTWWSMVSDLSNPEAPMEGKAAYVRYDGTSMAAPHVSGAVALLLAINPNLKLSGIRSILHRTAMLPTSVKQGMGDNSDKPHEKYGWGIINVERAAKEAKNLTEQVADLKVALINPENDKVVKVTNAKAESDNKFLFSDVRANEYYVVAGTDMGGTKGVYCEKGDLCGAFGSLEKKDKIKLVTGEYIKIPSLVVSIMADDKYKREF
jgi:subtilisin family serine protease